MGSRVESTAEKATLKLHGLRDGLKAVSAKTEPNAVLILGDQVDLSDVEQPIRIGQRTLLASGCE